MTAAVHEVMRTVRAAIGGWGPTVRLVTIVLVFTACAVLYRTL